MWTIPIILDDDGLAALPYIAVVLILLAAGGFAVWILRKKMFGKDESDDAVSFSLGNLKDLVKSGKMSETEYATIRAMLAAQMKSPKKPPPPKTDGPLFR
jgi:hypothetical protein